jgi:predicted Rossmann-fold nucleotide-binding protein
MKRDDNPRRLTVAVEAIVLDGLMQSPAKGCSEVRGAHGMTSMEVIRHTSGLERGGGGDSRGRSAGRKAAGQECRSEHYYTCRLLIPINDPFHRSWLVVRKSDLFVVLRGRFWTTICLTDIQSSSFLIISN